MARPLREPSRTRAVPARRRRVRLPTEGTYPYATGGVSSWCDLLVSRLDEFDVATGHGMRPAADVLADIDRHTWWSQG